MDETRLTDAGTGAARANDGFLRIAAATPKIRVGDVAGNADLPAVIDTLFGALLARAVLGEPATEVWLASIVETVWTGIARTSRAR